MVEPAGNISSVLGVVLQVGKWVAAPIGRRFMYLYNYNTNFDNLQEEVNRLKDAKDRVERKVDAAERNVEEIEGNVKKWQNNVEKTIAKAERLIQDKSNNPRCLKGLCPNLKTRYKHSKKAFKLKRDDIGPLLQQEEKFDRDSYASIQQSNCEKNFVKLRDAVLKLKNARRKVQRKVEKAKNNVEEIEEDVKKWLEDVDSIIVKAEELIENQSSIGTDRKTRYQNSKAASELMVDNIGPLLQQEERFDKVSHPTIHKEIWLRSNEDYLAFESRNTTLKNVWDALQDEKIYMMGVYGMGGLGKTTLVQEIGRKAEKDKLFDDIVFVEVTETPDIKKIQTIIANKLGVEFDDAAKEDESRRASKLYSRIENKNILLIVDNIWGELDLKTVGIPSRADRGRSKILMTTRNVDVLEKMGSTKNFGMGILNEEEAWSLFKKMAGGEILTCELNSLPQDVCKQCGGLPIVICTIAKALKSKCRPSDWKVALRDLKAPPSAKFAGLLEMEYMKMALSYKYLRDDELKKTFLLSSLMKNNTSISDFFIHVVGLDILERPNLNMEDARDRLDKLVRDLKDACLLTDGFTSEQFAMHDVVRAVAVTISYTDQHVFTGRNDVEREWKDKDKLKNCTKISLTDSSTVISELWPNDLDCPNLEYLYIATMWGSRSSFEIPEDFFMVMPKLKVLNLFGMQQSMLPSSLDLLTSLQTLCLNGSKIEDVAIIGKLKKLKVLSLRNSSINELPIELGQLTQLRLLDLSNCRQLKVIVPNVISKLSQLEELYTKGCFIQWKVEVLEELKLLSELASLELDIKDNKVLPKDFFSKELKRYKISVGGQWFKHYIRDKKDEGLRMFKLKLNSTISLEELRGIRNVRLFCLADFSDVKNSFNDSVTLTPLLNEKVVFTNLMTLELKNISRGKIWDNKFPTFMSSSYQNLTRFILEKCGKIKYVFPSSIAKSLQTLQHLEIKDCEVLEEIVAEEEGAKAVVNFAFPQVTYLKLENLPKLIAFYLGIHINLEDEFVTLLNEKVIFTNLMALELNNISCGKIWDSKFPTHMSSFYKNLTRFILKSCGKIKYVFPSSVAKSLQTLQSLEIRDCEVLEEIVAQEGGAEATVNFPFPLVTYLKLENLPKLIAFYPGIHTCEWPMLKELVINECGKFTSKYLSFQENSFHIPEPKSLCLEHKINHDLEELQLRKGGKKIIWQNQPNFRKGEKEIICQSQSEVLWESQDKVLTIKGDELANIPLRFLQRFENLKELKLFGCDQYKELVFPNLPNLEVLEVQDCSKLMNLASSSTSFQNLKVLRVDNCYELIKLITPSTIRSFVLKSCGKIKYVFPSSIAKSLQTLQSFEIRDCEVLEEIVAQEGGVEAAVNFPFPLVTYLKLEKLPNLTAFYPGIHICELPLLKRLVIKNCGKFTSKCLSFQENSFHIPKPKSLCLEHKVIFTNLMALELYNISSGKIWDNQFPKLYSSSYQNLTRFILTGCEKIKYVFPSSIAKSFRNLQHLEITHCKVLEEIVAEEEGPKAVVNFAFQQVTYLRLLVLPKLTAFYPGIHTCELPMLKTLMIEYCEKFTSKYLRFQENSFHISEPKSLRLEHKINSNLEDLSLTNKLRHITWQSQFKTLEIKNDESTNIPLGLLQRFENLEVLQLTWCKYKEMFSRGKDEEHMHITLGPSLASFQNLKVLNVIKCRKLMKLMRPSTARSLVQLRELIVEECEMVTEIVENEGDATTSTEFVFENLKKLLFRMLETLVCFCSGNYSFNFPSLEELTIGECPDMKTFSKGILSTPKLHKVSYESFNKTYENWEKIKEVENEGNDLNKTIQGEYKKQDISLELKLWTFNDINSTEISYNQHPTSFYQNLTHLFLWNCGNIKYAFPSSIAKSLHQLQQLMIGDCKVLEEIVAKEEGANAVVNFVFPNITLLKLQNLPELTTFYLGIHTSKWPMLKELVVRDCEKFTSKHMSFQEDGEEGELHISEPKSLFLGDKINHDLEVFEITNSWKTIIWQSHSKVLEISRDVNSTNFSFGLFQRFENLKKLELYWCYQCKELFFPNLPNLEVLCVRGCRNLMKLITPSTARNLMQLRAMSVEDCGMLTEIVKNDGEGDATTSTEIVFDQLKKLSLLGLESLTCFCSGNYSFSFPSLEELNIGDSPNMKTFSQGILSIPMLYKVNYKSFDLYENYWEIIRKVAIEGNELNRIIQQVHKKEVDSNLEKLTLSGRDIMLIWEGEFQESFGQVKTLQLINDAYASIPIQIIHKFNSLENLILKVSSYEEVFSFEEDKEHVEALTKLKDLELQGLFNLKCIWKQDSRLNSILQNLDSLKVEYCHYLTTLLPSLASFENLRILKVSSCNEMQNLMSSSTAKSLLLLEELSITNCEMIMEVVANEGDIEKGEIVFEKLKELYFYNLENLTCFCFGNYTLKFPNLESLRLYRCSKMKTFSGGGLSMPRLKKLNYKYCPESDTDTIIQQLQNDCSDFCERFEEEEEEY